MQNLKTHYDIVRVGRPDMGHYQYASKEHDAEVLSKNKAKWHKSFVPCKCEKSVLT